MENLLRFQNGGESVVKDSFAIFCFALPENAGEKRGNFNQALDFSGG